jgi:hypothetical protein
MPLIPPLCPYTSYVADAGRKHQEELWRWLGISVGGTVLPFGILALVFLLVVGHAPSWNDVLGHGELFIPGLIMNVETVWIWSGVNVRGRSLWFPLILILCGIAALAGVACFAVTSALQEMPPASVNVTSATMSDLSHSVPIFSASEFFLALVVGTIGIIARMLSKEEATTRE